MGYDQLVIIAVVVLASVALAAIWRMLSRRSSNRRRSTSLRLALDRLEEKSPRLSFDRLKEDYLPFVRFFEAAQEEVMLEDLIAAPRTRQALDRLKTLVALWEQKGREDSSQKTDEPAEEPGELLEIKACMVTIIREIYARPEWVERIPDEIHEEIDRLLDGLTG